MMLVTAAFHFFTLAGASSFTRFLERSADNREARELILLGQDADRGEYPWMVSLFGIDENTRQEIQMCAGSLISPDWVVTAAHCVHDTEDRFRLDNMSLRLGAHSAYREPTDVGRLLAHIEIHPHFDPNGPWNDIALIKMNRPVAFRTGIIPINLPEENANFEAQHVLATGWGIYKSPSQSAPTLQEVQLGVTSDMICAQNWSHAPVTAPNTQPVVLCAQGSPPDGSFYNQDFAATCMGDSGGPLSKWNSALGANVLVGITTFGQSECLYEKQTKPPVFVNVAHFVTWIKDTINPPPAPAGCTESATIQFHRDPNYNGDYQLQEGLVNSKPWYRKPNENQHLYFYAGASGGLPSWSLDDSPIQKKNFFGHLVFGDKDLANGGWIPPLANEELPRGNRSWRLPNRTPSYDPTNNFEVVLRCI